MHGTPLHTQSPSLITRNHYPSLSTPGVLMAGTPRLHADDTPPPPLKGSSRRDSPLSSATPLPNIEICTPPSQRPPLLTRRRTPSSQWRSTAVTCVYSVISSLQRGCTGCRVPFSDPRCFLPVTVYGTTHAHLVHMCWPLLWGLEIPLQPPPPPRGETVTWRPSLGETVTRYGRRFQAGGRVPSYKVTLPASHLHAPIETTLSLVCGDGCALVSIYLSIWINII